MTKARNIAAAVLESLRDVRECRAGARNSTTVRIEPGPLPDPTADAIQRIRAGLDLSRTVFAQSGSTVALF